MHPNSSPLISDSLTHGDTLKGSLGFDDSDINYYHSNELINPHASKIPSFQSYPSPPLVHRNTQIGLLGKYSNCINPQSRPPMCTQNGPLNSQNNITNDISDLNQGYGLINPGPKMNSINPHHRVSLNTQKGFMSYNNTNALPIAQNYGNPQISSTPVSINSRHYPNLGTQNGYDTLNYNQGYGFINPVVHLYPDPPPQVSNFLTPENIPNSVKSTHSLHMNTQKIPKGYYIPNDNHIIQNYTNTHKGAELDSLNCSYCPKLDLLTMHPYNNFRYHSVDMVANKDLNPYYTTASKGGHTINQRPTSCKSAPTPASNFSKANTLRKAASNPPNKRIQTLKRKVPHKGTYGGPGFLLYQSNPKTGIIHQPDDSTPPSKKNEPLISHTVGVPVTHSPHFPPKKRNFYSLGYLDSSIPTLPKKVSSMMSPHPSQSAHSDHLLPFLNNAVSSASTEELPTPPQFFNGEDTPLLTGKAVEPKVLFKNQIVQDSVLYTSPPKDIDLEVLLINSCKITAIKIQTIVNNFIEGKDHTVIFCMTETKVDSHDFQPLGITIFSAH